MRLSPPKPASDEQIENAAKAANAHKFITEVVFPADKEKGEAVKIGALLGFSDHKTETGAVGSIDIGKYCAVFNAAVADITGNADVGSNVYMTNAGDLTTTESGNSLFGVVVSKTTTSVNFAVI